jgi:hypothetical protein
MHYLIGLVEVAAFVAFCGWLLWVSLFSVKR